MARDTTNIPPNSFKSATNLKRYISNIMLQVDKLRSNVTTQVVNSNATDVITSNKLDSVYGQVAETHFKISDFVTLTKSTLITISEHLDAQNKVDKSSQDILNIPESALNRLEANTSRFAQFQTEITTIMDDFERVLISMGG